ncbi:MAG: RNA polymerase sigma factor [bacterium]
MYSADDELIKKCKAGDIEAFEKLIQRYEKKVFTIAYRYMGNKEDADDLAQEALIKVYKSIKKFRGESLFTTWLYQIVANVCRDALRKKARKQETSIDSPIITEEGETKREFGDSSLSPEILAEKAETEHYLQTLISQLKVEYKVVIIMREIQGFSYEEIAEELGCSLGTVKSRLNRARKHLRERIIRDEELYTDNSRLPSQKGESR